MAIYTGTQNDFITQLNGSRPQANRGAARPQRPSRQPTFIDRFLPSEAQWIELEARSENIIAALQTGIERILDAWPQNKQVGLRIRDKQGALEVTVDQPNKRKQRGAGGRRGGRAGLKDVFRYIRIYWRPYLGAGVLILGSMLSFQLFRTAFAYSLKVIVDAALTGAAISTVAPVVIGLLVAFPVVAFASVYGERITARVSSGIANDIRLNIFDHLQQLSLDYYKKAQLGDIMARFSTDMAVVERGVATRLAPGVVATVSAIVNVGVLFYLQWQLALATVLLLPMVYPLLQALTPRAAESQYKMKRREAQMTNAVQENVRAQSLIKSFGIQDAMRDQFRTELKQLEERNVEANFNRALVETSSTMGLFFVELLMTGVGALMVFNGALTAGSLIAYTAILSALNKDLYDMLRRTYPHLISASGGVRRIEEVLKTQSSIVEKANATELPSFSSVIRFEDVSFSYDGKRTHLNNVSFDIKKGQFVAFVGGSGAGKSTIFNLLLRFYDVQDGRVTIDGHDVRDATLTSLRSQMGVVLQETFLFNASILDNIRVVQPKASVIAAAKSAELHDFILSLPDGYLTSAGEAGGRLSGGQRQRVAIARALLSQSPILLLDEPTTALDNDTAADVMRTIERLAETHTIIMISHHLPSVVNADQIYVLDDGQIVEQGRHDDLLAADQTYAQLWRSMT